MKMRRVLIGILLYLGFALGILNCGSDFSISPEINTKARPAVLNEDYGSKLRPE